MSNAFNLPLLRKVVEWAAAEAKKPAVDSEWYQEYYTTAGTLLERSCGTAYCIAGWVTRQVGGHIITPLAIDGDYEATAAMDLLGISAMDAWGNEMIDGLFDSMNSIDDIWRIAGDIARRHGEEL